MRRVTAVLALVLALLAWSCGQKKEKPLSEPGEKVYAVKGKITARDATDNTVTLDHEAIPGFMEAMTMDYSVRGAEVAKLPQNGVPVEAKLHVTDKGFWLTDVRAAR